MSTPMRIAVIGGGGVGKSALTIRLYRDIFVEEYDPTIEDHYKMTRDYNEAHHDIDVLDTVEFCCDYDGARENDLWTRDAYAIVYSIERADTLDIAELQIQLLFLQREQFNDGKKAKVPMILVGNKSDLEDERQITTEEGKALADKYGMSFIETSAKTGENVELMLETLVYEIRSPSGENENPEEEKKGCEIQ